MEMETALALVTITKMGFVFVRRLLVVEEAWGCGVETKTDESCNEL
jgi:hypothetical protein